MKPNLSIFHWFETSVKINHAMLQSKSQQISKIKIIQITFYDYSV